MDTKRFKILNDKFDEYFLAIRNRKLPPPGFTKDNQGREIPYIKFDIGVAVEALSQSGAWEDEWLGKLGKRIWKKGTISLCPQGSTKSCATCATAFWCGCYMLPS